MHSSLAPAQATSPTATPPNQRRPKGSQRNSSISSTPGGRLRFLPLLFPSGDPDWTTTRERVADQDSSSIDWGHENSKERVRLQALGEAGGLHGLVARVWDSTIPWLVVVATGVLTGILAASIDMLSIYLSDLRFGVCTDAFWMSRSICCMGLEDGETCNTFKTWADLAGDPTSVLPRLLAQYGLYMLFSVVFAVLGSFFVKTYAPYAFHTGVSEIKTVLGGYIIADIFSPATLLITTIGTPLALGSGASIGKEGSLVHIACCLGNMCMAPFAVLRGNEARQRQVLSAAAAAGVSVAFGAPLGGVLFSLEEISTFFPGSTLWQSFVCAIVAAIVLQYIDPTGTGKLVLFQVTTSQIWRGFELIPWLFLGLLGGLWGVFFNRLNEEWERMRRATGLSDWPVTEVLVLSLFTATISYPIIFMRIPTSQLVSQLFQDCSAVDTYGICDTSQSFTVVTLLLVTAFAKTLLTAATFGASLPAGIFLPSLAIGACVGRSVGIMMAALQRAHPEAWFFTGCPADGACISPPIYAVIGAASSLGGATRLTISLVVIMFELTGAVDLVLQIMMVVMVSKFTGEYFSQNGLYEVWINLRNYPFLNTKVDYQDDDVVAKDVMTAAKDIICITDEGWSVSRLEGLLATEEYRGFPIVRAEDNSIVLGYIAKLELQAAIAKVRVADGVGGSTLCYFSLDPKRGPQIGPILADQQFLKQPLASPAIQSNSLALGTAFSTPSDSLPCWVSLRPWMDQTPITLNLDTPMEIVVQLFQRLGLRSVLLTSKGMLSGILTKMDIHAHLQLEPDLVERRLRPGVTAPPGLQRRHPRTYTGESSDPGGEEAGLLDQESH